MGIFKKLDDGQKALLAVGIFLGIVVAVNFTVIYLSAKTYDGLVEENYYKHGIEYQHEVLDQEALQSKLGWKVKFDNKKFTNKFKLSVIDKDAKPVSGANVKITFFRPTSQGFDKTIELKENDLGVYEAKESLPLQGIWDSNIEIRKEGLKWKKKQRINIQSL